MASSKLSGVDSKTQYFNGQRWIYISEYTYPERVLQYNEDGTASLVVPSEYIYYEDSSPFYLYESRTINSCLTGNHNVVYKNKGTGFLREKQGNIITEDFHGLIPENCILIGGEDISDRKLNILFRRICDGDTVAFIEAYGLSVDCRRKLVKKFFPCNLKGKINGVVLIENDVVREFVYSLMCLTGYTVVRGTGATLTLLHKEGDSIADTLDKVNLFYTGYFTNIGVGFIETNIRDKYCFEVPSHMLVLKRRNIIFVTGDIT